MMKRKNDDSTYQESARCPVCSSRNVAEFLHIQSVPVHCNSLWDTRAGALSAPRGDILLTFCKQCGHVFNALFDSTLMNYDTSYENSLHFSSHFQSYARSLAQRLVDHYQLREKHIIEIGCGKGEFLRMICSLGNNRGTGFDPSYDAAGLEKTVNGRVNFVKDFYSRRYADYKADLVIARHLLEHVLSPVEFLTDLHLAIGENAKTVVFFEVPNGLFMFRDLSIWDVIYEHYSYFTESSLAELFSRCGFTVENVQSEYDDQFLTIIAIPVAAPSARVAVPRRKIELLAALTDAYARNFNEKITGWREKLDDFVARGQEVVVWGGGSKGTMFLNFLHEHDVVKHVVDLNPYKHGMRIAGTGQLIVSPDFLLNHPVDIVIIMNAVYFDEIKQLLIVRGLSPQLICA